MQRTEYKMRSRDGSSYVCSSDLAVRQHRLVDVDADHLAEDHGVARARNGRWQVDGLQVATFQVDRRSLHARPPYQPRGHHLEPGAGGLVDAGRRRRSEARSVGEACFSRCRLRWWPYESKK